jgi:hypothetical protein
MFHINVQTIIFKERSIIWKRVSCFSGVNEELYPLMQMTCPDPTLQLTSQLISNKPLFRSWLLLFGFIPIDYDLIGITDCKEGHSFSERSSMGLMSKWHHDRFLHELNDNQTQVVDKLSFISRIPFTGFILSFIVRMLFKYRHYKLKTFYGGNITKINSFYE